MDNHGKILLVEDDELQSKIIGRIIKNMGFDVKTAETAETAESIIIEWEPNLVLLDIYLPDKNGITFLSEILEKKPELKIVLISADSSEEVIRRGIYAGALDVLKKPIQVKDLMYKFGLWLNDEHSDYEITKIIEETEANENIITDEYSKTISQYILSYKTSIELTEKSVFGSVLYFRLKNFENEFKNAKLKEITAFLSRLYLDITSLIYNTRGSVNTVSGNTIIGTFGLPVVYDNDTLNAVRCADQIRNLIRNYKRLPDFIKDRLKPAIGIGTGTIYGGKVLSIQRIDYSIFGDACERARSLAYLAGEEGEEILTDENTVITLGNDLKARQVEKDKKICDNIEKVFTIDHVKQELSTQEIRQLDSIGEKELQESDEYELL
ncbi:MAG: response regulator [Spirochaetia bacterium]|nr:response regulator [Spirochaetia bacterium]